MKTVGEIAAVLRQYGLLQVIVTGNTEAGQEELTGVTYDSREVKKGTLFICKGNAFQSAYLDEAIRRGCSAYLIEEQLYLSGIAGCAAVNGGDSREETSEKNRAAAALLVTDIRKAMAAASAAFYEYRPGLPSLTGITGTKGKTTTAWYLKAMLDLWQKEEGGKETGLISTVENYDGKQRQESVMTTPEAPVLHRFLATAREQGLSYTTMEVSSQALKYKRVWGLRFQVGVFLNISEDHISPLEHTDFEDYFTAKLSMFRQTETACINLDCDHARRILKAARKAGRILTFGQAKEADIRYSDVRIAETETAAGKTEKRLTFQVSCDRFTEEFSLAMHGRFNIENAVAAIAAAYVYGVPVYCMKRALEETTVPGRMESFLSRDGKICALVDFAHNRLSFERLFDAVYGEYSSYQQIITVFGCPGGKALNRRRELGILAGLFSDQVCVTSDSPGMECQQKIADEIKNYVELVGCPCCCVPERREAVNHAVEMAAKKKGNTLILLLGRGSEQFQKLGNQVCSYPRDAALAKEALAAYDGFPAPVRENVTQPRF